MPGSQRKVAFTMISFRSASAWNRTFICGPSTSAGALGQLAVELQVGTLGALTQSVKLGVGLLQIGMDLARWAK